MNDKNNTIFYLLEEKDEQGVIVMDKTEKQYRRFVSCMEKYFSITVRGRTFVRYIVKILQ